MACQPYSIVLTVRTRDVRNHDRLQPVWGSLRLAPITILNGEMMALDCQPISIVKDQGFVSLLNQQQPHYKIPSRKYFSAMLIPELLYAKCKETVEKILQSQAFVALTCDTWSSHGHDSVISFTAHFITDKFASEIQSKTVCVLQDGGTNFVAGFNSSDVNSLTCLVHNLQRVIHDGVLAQRDVLGAGRRTAIHYKHSNVAFYALQRIQAQLELKVCTLYQDYQQG